MSGITGHFTIFFPKSTEYVAFIQGLENATTEEELAAGLHCMITVQKFGPKALTTATEIIAKAKSVVERQIFMAVSTTTTLLPPIVRLIASYAREVTIVNIVSNPFFSRSFQGECFSNANALSLIMGQCAKERSYSTELQSLTKLIIDENPVIQEELGTYMANYQEMNRTSSSTREMALQPYFDDVYAYVQTSKERQAEVNAAGIKMLQLLQEAGQLGETGKKKLQLLLGT